MKSLTFEVRSEDASAFQRFWICNTREGEAIRMALALLVPPFLLFFGPTKPLVIASCVVLGFAIWYRSPWAFAKMGDGRIQQMAKQPHGGGVICSHTLTIGDDGLTETTAVSSWTTAWAMVGPVHVGDERSFIFVGQHMAHIIPRMTVTDGQYDEFLEAVKERASGKGA